MERPEVPRDDDAPKYTVLGWISGFLSDYKWFDIKKELKNCVVHDDPEE